ncbi:MAG: glycosyltransferase family 2 protein [Betaproteobacteria bacterium]|nr:glycosyltransferase family 2 protein [Betaproteobacteria bacterium]
MPKVSVVLPVFNGELHIAAAIRSILSQSLADLALIVVDDGSVDSTALIVSSIEDRRIKLVRNQSNKGICFSLNRGLDLADSEYVARMDADDVARPTRLEAQVGFADRHHAVACCGSWMEEFGHGRRIVKRLPLRHGSLTALMCFDSPCFTRP